MFGNKPCTSSAVADDGKDGKTKAKPKPKSPSKNRQEWIRRNMYKEWPIEDNLQKFPEPVKITGDLSDIKKDLRKHACWDNDFLDSVDARLKSLEEQLIVLSKQFMSEEKELGDGLKIITVGNANKFCNPDVLRALYMKKMDHAAAKNPQSAERPKTVEEAVFPGLPVGAAPLLPGNIDTLPLLDSLTKMLNFNGSFLNYWRKTAFLDESVAFLQLCFWWLWMEHCRIGGSQQSEVFTRMAESFTELVIRTRSSPKHRDEFFLKYPSCICQAIHTTFCQAFPQSIYELQANEFLQWLCNNIYELITGLPSPLECWKDWPSNDSLTFSIEGFNQGQPLPTTPATAKKRGLQFQDMMVVGAQSDGIMKSSKMGSRQQQRTAVTDVNRTELTRPSIGPGPSFESVRFGTGSCSPLLQHYLWSHGLMDTSRLKDNEKHCLLTRTQITKQTYPNYQNNYNYM